MNSIYIKSDHVYAMINSDEHQKTVKNIFILDLFCKIVMPNFLCVKYIELKLVKLSTLYKTYINILSSKCIHMHECNF